MAAAVRVVIAVEVVDRVAAGEKLVPIVECCGLHHSTRALGVSSSSYSKPFGVAANQPFRLTSAMRWELLATPTQRGQFPVECRIMDWIHLKRDICLQDLR